MRLRLIREDNMREPIIIVDYDPAWPQVYEVERARILRVASGLIVDIEHIEGSLNAGYRPCLAHHESEGRPLEFHEGLSEICEAVILNIVTGIGSHGI